MSDHDYYECSVEECRLRHPSDEELELLTTRFAKLSDTMDELSSTMRSVQRVERLMELDEGGKMADALFGDQFRTLVAILSDQLYDVMVKADRFVSYYQHCYGVNPDTYEFEEVSA